MVQSLDARVVSVFPVTQDAWLEIFNHDPSATAFQSPQWMTASANGRYTDASRLYSTSDGKVLLPLAETTWLTLRLAAASMPHGLGRGRPDFGCTAYRAARPFHCRRSHAIAASANCDPAERLAGRRLGGRHPANVEESPA